MPQFELLFSHDFTLDEHLYEGDAFRYRGEVWRVARVKAGNPHPRVFLELWPNGEPFPHVIHGESV